MPAPFFVLNGRACSIDTPSPRRVVNLSTGATIRYNLDGSFYIPVGRRTPWNRSISPSVRNAAQETWYLYLISEVRGRLSVIKPGSVRIQIVAITSKSGMATFI